MKTDYGRLLCVLLKRNDMLKAVFSLPSGNWLTDYLFLFFPSRLIRWTSASREIQDMERKIFTFETMLCQPTSKIRCALYHQTPLFLYYHPGDCWAANVTFSIWLQTTAKGVSDGDDVGVALDGHLLHLHLPAQPQHCHRGGEDPGGENQVRQSPGLC